MEKAHQSSDTQEVLIYGTQLSGRKNQDNGTREEWLCLRKEMSHEALGYV